MAIHIHTDASVSGDATYSRGAFLIEKKVKRGSTTKTTHKYAYRTNLLKRDHIGSDEAETYTMCVGLMQAIKLFPDDNEYWVYSDSKNSIRKLQNFSVPKLLHKGSYHKYEKSLYRYIMKHHKGHNCIIKFEHVKGHKGELKSYSEKMNFVCDYLCSVKGLDI